MQLETLRDDLFQKWRGAFKSNNILDECENKVVTWKYALQPCYHLKDYNKGKLKISGKLQVTKPATFYGLCYAYGFDKNNKLCFTRTVHHSGEEYSKAYFLFANTLIQYVEFTASTAIPAKIERLVLDNKRKLYFQALELNGGGMAPIYNTLDQEAIKTHILQNQYAFFCTVELYHYENNLITQADCLSIAPGIGQYFYKNVYSYNEKKQLEEIKTYFDNGHDQLAFVKKNSKTSVKQLVATVAEKMAIAIIDELKKAKLSEPIVNLELGYRYVANYIPSIAPLMESTRRQILENSTSEDVYLDLFLYKDTHCQISILTFEKEFQQIMQVMEESDNWDIGSKMLRNTASVLTKSKLNNEVPVTEDFVAYAIDHSIEHENFSQLLKECGVAKEIIKEWRKKWWIKD